MFLKKINKSSQEQLFEKLRKVPLLNQPDRLPYAQAKFEIKLVRPKDLQPSAFYVLRHELTFLALLMDELARNVGGIEKIDALLEYQDEFGYWDRMMPPVVELTDFGEWMILDGEHRSFITKWRKTEIPMLFIQNVKHPYPCLPLPRNWRSVKIVEKVPVHKRLYREGLNDTPETKYNLHRDLSKFGSRGTRKPLSPI